MESTKLTKTLIFSHIILFFLSRLTYGTAEGFTLELIHRDSVHSPLYPGNLTATQRLHRLIQFSESQNMRFESTIVGPQNVNIRPILSHSQFVYMVRIAIGSTNPVPIFLVFDTGSRLVWTQCEPCNPCFPQNGPKYRPAASPTFLPIPCNHTLCMPPNYNCINGQCVYEKRYIDNSYTKGILAQDQFIFPSRTSGMESISSIVFGCSRESSTRMFLNTIPGGIMGMSPGRESFIMQLASRVDNRFSYCLVPSDHSANSFLRFGTDIVMPRHAQSTQLLTRRKLHYYVSLLDISIDGHRLHLPQGIFDLHSAGGGGCIIDSGTIKTNMIAPAYNLVKTGFMEYFREFNLTMVSASDTNFDLCYRLPRNFRAFPSMDYHFQGANLHVEAANVFTILEDSRRFCLMMRPHNDFTIIGAVHQQNIQFVFDIGRQKLYFAPQTCAQS